MFGWLLLWEPGSHQLWFLTQWHGNWTVRSGILLQIRYDVSYKTCLWFCRALFGFASWWIHVINLPISFRITSLALGLSYDCPSASEVTLKDRNPIRTKPKQSAKKKKIGKQRLKHEPFAYVSGVLSVVNTNVRHNYDLCLYPLHFTGENYLWIKWYGICLSPDINFFCTKSSIWGFDYYRCKCEYADRRNDLWHWRTLPTRLLLPHRDGGPGTLSQWNLQVCVNSLTPGRFWTKF